MLETLKITSPISLRRRGVETKIIVGERIAEPDVKLISALRKSHRWAERVKAGEGLKTLAASESISERYAARVLALATLSPSIQTAIVKGIQPVDLTLEKLMRSKIPLDWAEQEQVFGSAA